MLEINNSLLLGAETQATYPWKQWKQWKHMSLGGFSMFGHQSNLVFVLFCFELDYLTILK